MDEHTKQELPIAQDSNEVLQKLITDAWSKLLKPADAPEKQAEKQAGKFSEAELAKVSKNAADIISRNDDFGYGIKRDRLRDIFETAVNKGPDAVRQLTDAINTRLIEKKSTMLCTGVCSQESETVDESVQPKHGELVYVPPQYYKHTYASGNFSLTDKATGSVEDNTSVRGKELWKEHLGNSSEPKTRVLPYFDLSLIPIYSPK